jgi:hypothetical protein
MTSSRGAKSGIAERCALKEDSAIDPTLQLANYIGSKELFLSLVDLFACHSPVTTVNLLFSDMGSQLNPILPFSPLTIFRRGKYVSSFAIAQLSSPFYGSIDTILAWIATLTINSISASCSSPKGGPKRVRRGY